MKKLKEKIIFTVHIHFLIGFYFLYFVKKKLKAHKKVQQRLPPSIAVCPGRSAQAFKWQTAAPAPAHCPPTTALGPVMCVCTP